MPLDSSRKKIEKESPMNEQQQFYECPECASIVERVYQNGVCRACLNKKLQAVRLVIDTNHILKAGKLAAY
ncbi:MAG TPA: hypothetical protein PLY93_02185 [Turneriella sp.]|nr:hypothetical protein [Turneriella sp.]